MVFARSGRLGQPPHFAHTLPMHSALKLIHHRFQHAQPGVTGSPGQATQPSATVTAVSGSTPLVLDSPHSGTQYPADFGQADADITLQLGGCGVGSSQALSDGQTFLKARLGISEVPLAHEHVTHLVQDNADADLKAGRTGVARRELQRELPVQGRDQR